MSELYTNESNERLIQEIERLSNDLIKCQKYIQLLEKYRKYLLNNANYCKCKQNIGLKININSFENEYKLLSDNYNNNENDIKIKDEVLDQNINIDENEDNYNQNISKDLINNSSKDCLPVEDNVSNNNKIKTKKLNSCHWPGCEYRQTDRKKLKFHEKNHTNERELKRNYIESNFQTKTQYNYNNSMKNENKFSCDECEFSSTCEKYIALHKKRNHNGNTVKYKCDYNGCNTVLKHFRSLKKHQQLHKCKTNTYLCDWPELSCDWADCELKFYTKYDLIKHQRTHTKPFVCDWPDCEHRARSQAGIDAHKRIHTGEKPYICLE